MIEPVLDLDEKHLIGVMVLVPATIHSTKAKNAGSSDSSGVIVIATAR
jgi:hypothetical protein